MSNGSLPAADRSRVADAILAALDAERERAGRRRRPSSVELLFLKALGTLGDPRVGSELARRARDETGLRTRAAYALAAHRLGVSGPLVALARSLAGATLPFPPRRGWRRDQVVPDSLAELIEGLGQSELPEADHALAALADPAHPYFPLLLRDLLTADKLEEHPLARHPYCLGVLRGALTDQRPTGTHFFLRDAEIEVLTGPKTSRLPLSTGAIGWREHAEERIADRAAGCLDRLAIGLPEPHPLRPDADRVLDDLRATLLRYEFRPLTHPEHNRLGLFYGPVINCPDRPATAADVRAGRAVFALPAPARVLPGPWPDWVLLKSKDPSAVLQWGLVVQAEVGSDGKAVYGAIFRHEIRAVKADEVECVESNERR